MAITGTGACLAAALWLGHVIAIAISRRILFARPKQATIPETRAHVIYPISLALDGATLHGWLARPRTTSSTAILYFNGRKESPTTLFSLLAETPEFAVMVFHRRGLGPSSGKPSEHNHVRDGLKALDWLCQYLSICPSAVTIIGRSLGSGVAVQVAGARDVRSLVLLSPFDSLQHIVKFHYPWLPEFILRDKFSSIDHVALVRCPCLSIVGELDRVIPPRFSRALFGKWPGSHEEYVIPDGGHRGLLRNPAVLAEIARFSKVQSINALA